MLDTHEENSKKKLGATVLTVAVIAGCIVFTDHLRAQERTTVATAAPATMVSTATDVTSTTQSATPNTSTDGLYSASSNYYVPHGNESIQVSITLKDGVISNASIRNSESDRESAQYQEDFASVFKSYVVGKKISSLKLGVVAGASDTTQGFNNALSQIALKAQA
jgi:hypothetical protein